jgi:hypothetical protein
VGQFDLIPVMDGQPLTLLAQTRDGGRAGTLQSKHHNR